MDINVFEASAVLFILTSYSCVSAWLLDGFHKTTTPPTCDTVAGYRVLNPAYLLTCTPSKCKVERRKGLLERLTTDECISDTEVWSIVKPLFEQRYDCYRQFVNVFAKYTENNRNLGQQCHCTGEFPKVYEQNHYDHIYFCSDTTNINCKYLVDYFFLRHKQQHSELSVCQTNHHVWTRMRDVNDRGNRDYHRELTQHLVQTYTHGNEHVCQCYIYATSSTNPATTTTTTTKTTMKPPTTTTKTPSVVSVTQTAQPELTTIGLQRCHEYDAILYIAENIAVSQPEAYPCPAGSRESSEAYVLSTCDLNIPENWVQGPKVLDNCDTLHAYTPIASFTTSSPGLRANVGLAAIFLECSVNGIKMAFQNCDSAPMVIQINDDNATHIYNAKSYHVIL